MLVSPDEFSVLDHVTIGHVACDVINHLTARIGEGRHKAAVLRVATLCMRDLQQQSQVSSDAAFPNSLRSRRYHG